MLLIEKFEERLFLFHRPKVEGFTVGPRAQSTVSRMKPLCHANDAIFVSICDRSNLVAILVVMFCARVFACKKRPEMP